MESTNRTGVLLANLGTPTEPTPKAVKRFLSEFLHDQRVVDLSRWLWCPLLHGIILPVRAPKVARLYQSIWMDEGSPLMVYSQRQKRALETALGMPVELGMTYGEPGVGSGIQALLRRNVQEIIVLPLYPQYSATTTGAVFDKIAREFSALRTLPSIHFIRDYHQHSRYIEALAHRVKQHWAHYGRGEYLLCSYHGIPRRYADNGDCYPDHCQRTTQLLQLALGLDEKEIGMSYQSRFGREEWLTPYTDETLGQLPKMGISKLDVISPAFSVDCLETLEEIAVQGKDTFLSAGGTEFQYIPCLNDDSAHVAMMQQLVEENSVLLRMSK